MSARLDLIRKRLAEAGEKTAAYFRGLPPEAYAQQVYTTGPQWRVQDILAHFVSAEQTMVYYGREIVAGGPGAPADFVIDEFNAAQVAALGAAGPAELIGRYEAARQATLALAAGWTDADLDRIGRHPWFGRVPLDNMLKLVYRHNLIHERDVRKALETGLPVAHVDAQPPAAG